MYKFNRWTILSLLIITLSCQSTSIDTNTINTAILAHGGWEAWHKLDSLSFTKSTFSGPLYDTLIKKEEVLIESHGRSIRVVDLLTKDTLYKKNNQYLSSRIAEEAIKKRVEGTAFTIDALWKLSSKEYLPEYLGVSDLMGDSVHILQFNYRENEDRWRLYFRVSDHQMMAMRVWHNDKFSLITNSDYVPIHGVRYPRKRVSYQVSENNEIIKINASYLYEYF